MKGQLHVDKAEKIHSLFYRFERPSFKANNRFVRSATNLGRADEATGEISFAEIKRLTEIAAGGAGTLITGLAYISPEGKSLNGQWGLHTDDRIKETSPDSQKVPILLVPSFIVQLCHGGGQREASVARRSKSFSPSGIYPGCDFTTDPLSKDGIRKITEDFAPQLLSEQKRAGRRGRDTCRSWIPSDSVLVP